MSKMKLFNAADIRSAVQPLAEQLPSISRSSASQPSNPTTVEEFDNQIRSLWATAQQTFIAIGQHLHQAQLALSSEDFIDLCSRLPFGKSARSQLMTAYRLIEAKKLPAGCERAGYATIYLCASLTDDECKEAIETGTIAPDMTRAQIIAFKQAKRQAKSRSNVVSSAARKPSQRVEEIRTEISFHEQRLTELREELANILEPNQ